MGETCEMVEINGVSYVRKDTVSFVDKSGMEYVITRPGKASSVFAGYLKEHEGTNVTLVDARRIYYWKGAFTLSDLAVQGTKEPSSCKFAPPVVKLRLTDVCEIITCSEAGAKSIQGVPEWKK